MKAGLLFRLSSFWIGLHWSPANRRLFTKASKMRVPWKSIRLFWMQSSITAW